MTRPLTDQHLQQRLQRCDQANRALSDLARRLPDNLAPQGYVPSFVLDHWYRVWYQHSRFGERIYTHKRRPFAWVVDYYTGQLLTEVKEFVVSGRQMEQDLADCLLQRIQPQPVHPHPLVAVLLDAGLVR